MKLGYARVDITPTEPVPLAGYGNTSMRISNHILSPLCSACAAITDDTGNTALLFHNDLTCIPARFSDSLREMLCAATGVPFENIMLHATHTHSAPDLGNKAEPGIPAYLELLKSKLTEAAAAAMADRKSVTHAQMSKTRTQDLSFVRHYILKDGSYKGDNFGDLNRSPYEGHTTEPDSEMRLVKFHRQGGKDVLLVNWQSHPHRTGGSDKYDVSADIIGAMRDEIESSLDCEFLYFSGASGNINPSSRMKKDKCTADFLEQGKALASAALAAEGSYQPLNLTEVKVSTQKVWSETNRPAQHLLEGARIVQSHWEKTNDFLSSCALASSYGINSPYAASAIIRHHKDPHDGYEVPFTAISFGDLAFLAVPYEMFDTNAKYIRDHSPFLMTLVASCTNDYLSYVPSAYGYVHGCYESDCSLFKPGTGERFAYAMLRMLNGLKL